MYYDYFLYLYKFLLINVNGDFKVGIIFDFFRMEGLMNIGVYIFDYVIVGFDYLNGVNNYWFIL